MEVTYSVTARDLVWGMAREFLRANPAILRRALWTLAYVLAAPFLVVALFHDRASTVFCGFLLFLIAGCMFVVGAIAMFGQRLFAPLLDQAVDGLTHRLSIGPDCLAETGAFDIVTPWDYVESVAQDLWSISIIVGPDHRYIIPRRAFRNYFASWVFSVRARRYWRTAHPRIRRSSETSLTK